MKPIDIFNSVKPGTVLYQAWCGRIMKCRYKLTEVETGYYGDRNYKTVLEDENGSCSTWVDRSGQEWFTKKEDAIKYAIERCQKQISELEGYVRNLKSELD